MQWNYKATIAYGGGGASSYYWMFNGFSRNSGPNVAYGFVSGTGVQNHHNSDIYCGLTTLSGSTTQTLVGTESGSSQYPNGIYPFASVDVSNDRSWYGVLAGSSSFQPLKFTKVDAGGQILSSTQFAVNASYPALVTRAGVNHWIVMNGSSFCRSSDDGTSFSNFSALPTAAGRPVAPLLAGETGTLACVAFQSDTNSFSILRSVTFGNSWEVWPLPSPMPRGLGTDRGGRWILACDGADAMSPDVYIRLSTDDAQTWSVPFKISGAYPRSTVGEFVDVTADGRNHWVAIWQGGQAVSEDDGLTWEAQSATFTTTPRDITTDGVGHWFAAVGGTNLSLYSLDLFPPTTQAENWQYY